MLVGGVFIYKNWDKISGFISPKKPKITKSGTTVDLIRQTHGNLFRAELEYDSKTGVVVQLQTGLTNGDTPYFLQNSPQSFPGDLVYRVEIVSNENELLQTGWKVIPQEILISEGDKTRFVITTVYKPKAMVRVYLPDGKLIWTGIMQ
ncbi:MAG: hypothetical protein AAB599_00075 [Patescibacteria group bacterium]